MTKNRNYSFEQSRRLPSERMTEVNGVKIPSMPGSCYHAIICALSQNKNKFSGWDKVIELTEKYMKQYGGTIAWDKFVKKGGVKGYKQRVKDNCHTLTRTGRDCYGFRLHEKGMAIYFFKDGAILFTGGVFNTAVGKYDVDFPDGRKLQKRYRGTTMTYNEYKKFLESGYIDLSGTILNQDAIRDFRSGLAPNGDSLPTSIDDIPSDAAQVCITLVESADDDCVDRLTALGLQVEQRLETEIIGSISAEKLHSLSADKDVVDVVAVGENDV